MINGFASRLDETAPTARQADPANQRDSWLRQMELAQMADMNKAAGPRGTQQQAGPQASAARAAATPQARSMHAERQDKPQADAGQSRKGQAQPRGTQAPAQEQAAAEQPQQQAAQDAGARHTAAVVPQAQAALLPLQLHPSGAPGAAIDPLAGALLAAAVGAARGATGGADGEAIARPAQRPGMAGFLSGSAADSGSGAERTDAGEAADAAAPADSEEQLAEQRQFEKRMMHLTGKGDDVKLWIRDSALTQAQSLELVYRMAGDIASQGLRLRSATVNGKPAVLDEAGQRFEDSLETEQLTPITNLKDHHGDR